MKRRRASKNSDLVRELMRLREEFALLRQDVLSSRPSRCSVSSSALAELYAAIYLVVGECVFTASILLDETHGGHADAVFLRDKLQGLIGPDCSVRLLSSFLGKARSRAGEWQLEIVQDRAREGRLFRVTRVTSFITQSTEH